MWSPCRAVSALVGLAVEAIEAVAFLFDFSDPADKLYGEAVAALGADGLAEKEAQEEVAEAGEWIRVPEDCTNIDAVLVGTANPSSTKAHLRKWCCGTVVPGPHAEGCTLTPRNGSLVSSAASGAATAGGSPVEDGCPAPLIPPTGAGQLPLNSRELLDAAYAVEGFAETSPVPDGWLLLASKLRLAAQ